MGPHERERHLAEQRELWEGEAARFDDEPDHGLREPATREAWGRLLARHLPEPASDVVDLGCGTGSLAVLLAEHGHRVRGLDLAPAMVAAARAEAADLGARVELVVGDAGSPPYDDASADVVLGRHVLWALPDAAGALARWRRLLRPDGRLVMVEGRWHTGGGLSAKRTEELLRSVPGEPWSEVVVEHLPDPALWGGPLRDERYLVAAR